MACAQKISEEEKYVFEHRRTLESVNSDAAGEGGLYGDVFADISNALRLLMANDSYMRFVTTPLYREGCVRLLLVWPVLLVIVVQRPFVGLHGFGLEKG